MDLRDLAPVRSTFGPRPLSNPLNTAEFPFPNADAAEPAPDMEVWAPAPSVYQPRPLVNPKQSFQYRWWERA